MHLPGAGTPISLWHLAQIVNGWGEAVPTFWATKPGGMECWSHAALSSERNGPSLSLPLLPWQLLCRWSVKAAFTCRNPGVLLSNYVWREIWQAEL